MLTTDQLANLYNTGARINFLASGELMPMIAFHGGVTELLVQLKPGRFHPSDQLCAVAFGFGSVLPCTHIATVTETWKKAFDEGNQPESMERGYLEELHRKGDTAVHTALLVLIIDVKDAGGSQVWTTDVDADTEPLLMHSGLEGANMGQRVLAAYKHGQGIGHPKAVDWETMGDLLGATGLISSVVQFNADDPHRWN